MQARTTKRRTNDRAKIGTAPDENPNMKTGLLIFLFVAGTLSFKQIWDGKRSLLQKWIYGVLAVTCWIAIAAVV